MATGKDVYPGGGGGDGAEHHPPAIAQGEHHRHQLALVTHLGYEDDCKAQ